MKSMVIIDTPDHCTSCPFNVSVGFKGDFRYVCTACQRNVTDIFEKIELTDKIPEWCPLKPIPDKSISDATMKLVDVLFELDEVMK